MVISVAVDEAGLNVERGIASCKNAKMAYVTPSHQFPLGFMMSLGCRLALLDWAHKTNAWILEDDYGSYFRYAGRPVSSLQGLDEHNRVLYIGTFSRVIFPAIRLCYLVVPSPLVDSFSQAQYRLPLGVHFAHAPNVACEVSFAYEVSQYGLIDRSRVVIDLKPVSELRRQLASHLDVKNSQAGMHVVAEFRDMDRSRKRTSAQRLTN